MTYLGNLGSIFTWRGANAHEQSPTCSKFSKAVAGLGVAGLAILSWKIVAASALAYSAYRGGQYIHERYFQKHLVKKETGAQVVDIEESQPFVPVSAGHDAHGDQQEEKQPEIDHLADLKKKQQEFKSRAAKNTFEILLTHPDAAEKAGNLQWVGKMIKKHAPWSKRTFGLSLYAVKAYRSLCKHPLNCKPKKK